MRVTWSLVVAAIALAAGAMALACGDDDAASPEGARDRQAKLVACRAYFEAACSRLAECGSPIRCEDATARCPDALFGPGTTRTVAELTACADVRRTQRCSEILVGKVPACATPGTRAAGETCHFDAQCESGRCLAEPQGSCGLCALLSGLGGECDRTRACGYVNRCEDNPTAFGGTCVAFEVPPDLEPGAACGPADPKRPRCPVDHACLADAPQSASGTCRKMGENGAACPFRAGGPVHVCASGSCLPPATPDGGRTCGAPRGPGEPCGNVTGAVCASELTCSSPTEGTCIPRHDKDQSCGAEGECKAGLFCSLDTPEKGYCREPIAIGQPCFEGTFNSGEPRVIPCAAPNTCREVKDRASRICVGPLVAIGEACDPIFRPCGDGITCSPSGVCVLATCTADGGI